MTVTATAGDAEAWVLFVVLSCTTLRLPCSRAKLRPGLAKTASALKHEGIFFMRRGP